MGLQTSGILDVFTASEIDQLATERSNGATSTSSTGTRRYDMAAFEVALAIGAGNQPTTDADSLTTVSPITSAMQSAFAGQLTDPSISMIRVFLLLAFYMVSTGQKCAASMYMAISGRAALHLGLHQLGLQLHVSDPELDKG